MLSQQLAALFTVGVALTCLLLGIEHALVAGGKTKRLNMAFFTVNGIISVLLGVAGILDIFSRA